MSISKSSISMTINGLDQTFDIRRDETILEACLRHKLNLPHSCGGFGTCGTCQIKILSGQESCNERNELEQEMALDRNFQNFERLACQTSCTSSITIANFQHKNC